jgi:hypothetical protein
MKMLELSSPIFKLNLANSLSLLFSGVAIVYSAVTFHFNRKSKMYSLRLQRLERELEIKQKELSNTHRPSLRDPIIVEISWLKSSIYLLDKDFF